MDRVKLEALNSDNRNIWEAWRWFKDNSDRFESDVLGPLCMEVSVADKESADMVEAALGFDKFLFVVDNDRDYDAIGKIQRQNDRHPIKAANVVKWTRTDIPPSKIEGVSSAKLSEYDIKGTLIDR